MARLNGGRLFLDLTSYGDIYAEGGINGIALSNEEIECILTKGLTIKMLYGRVIIVKDVNFTNFFFSNSVLLQLHEKWYVNGNEFHNITLSLEDKTLSINEI